MTWAYSPSYGKPLSVPQGVVGLMTRFGMDVVLAHPEGYEIMPEVEAIAKRQCDQVGGGSFTRTNAMDEAFEGAHVVYPKSWASFSAMEKRTELYGNGDFDGIKALEKELLAENAKHKDWECTEERMAKTDERLGALHALPAGRHHRRVVQGRRSGRQRVRPLPGTALQGGQLQALCHRGHDLPGQDA